MSLSKKTTRLRGVLSPREVAGMFGVTNATLLKWIKRGYVEPTLFDGGKPYFSPQRVEEIKKLLETPVMESKEGGD